MILFDLKELNELNAKLVNASSQSEECLFVLSKLLDEVETDPNMVLFDSDSSAAELIRSAENSMRRIMETSFDLSRAVLRACLECEEELAGMDAILREKTDKRLIRTVSGFGEDVRN